MGRAVDDDPLARAMAPPPNETPEQRELRITQETRARKISEEIDEELKAQKIAMKKLTHVKVLLLGQSESGKSTTLKNFQLTYSHDTWQAELLSWRPVIQWNLLRNIQTILDLLTKEMAHSSTEDEQSDHNESSDDNDKRNKPSAAPTSGEPSPTPRRSAPSVNQQQSPPLKFSEKHRLLKLQLGPLRAVQKDIEELLGASTREVDQPEFAPARLPQEVFVRSSGWKSMLSHGRRSVDIAPGKVKRKWNEEATQSTEILAKSAQAIKELWEDETIREMLKRKRVRLDTMPGFFISDVNRIATRSYVPTNEDVVRARLRTLGVQEHHIHFDTGPAAGMDWILYDVGGSRTQRAAWFPYFDDCDAIIFLAPISCFDEKLAEDRKVNRLEDSFALWRMICSSKLLARAQIILFLNKCDLLEKKLRRGIQVREFVPSFGKRSNDVQTVSQYFAQHFKEIGKQCSPHPRPFRVHLTSVIDTKATAATLHAVEDGILQAHMRRLDLI